MKIESDLLSLFHANNWVKLSIAKRKQVLEQLEYACAKHQGRKPCQIKLFESEDYKGYYDKGIIHLNKTLLKDENIYASIFFTLHEGVHAWQIHACKNLDQYPWIEEIIKNSIATLKKDDVDRYLQPVEKQADVYAYREIRQIYTKLSERGLNDHGFWKYIEDKKKAHEEKLSYINKKYGTDYRTYVQNKVNYKYDLLLEFEEKYPGMALLFDDDIEEYINKELNKVFCNKEISLKGFNFYLIEVLEEKKSRFKKYLEEKKRDLENGRNKELVDLFRSLREIDRLLRNKKQKSFDNKKGEHPKIKETRRNAKILYEMEDVLER